jgi:hypothetical protein
VTADWGQRTRPSSARMRTVTFSSFPFSSFSLHRQRCRAILSDASKARSRCSLGGERVGTFCFFHAPLRHYDIARECPSTGPGEGGPTGALSLNSELGVCFPSTLFLCYEMRTEKTHQLHRRRIVVWWKGAPLRLRLCKTRSPPFCRLAGPLGEFRGP